MFPAKNRGLTALDIEGRPDVASDTRATARKNVDHVGLSMLLAVRSRLPARILEPGPHCAEVNGTLRHYCP